MTETNPKITAGIDAGKSHLKLSINTPKPRMPDSAPS